MEAAFFELLQQLNPLEFLAFGITKKKAIGITFTFYPSPTPSTPPPTPSSPPSPARSSPALDGASPNAIHI